MTAAAPDRPWLAARRAEQAARRRARATARAQARLDRRQQRAAAKARRVRARLERRHRRHLAWAAFRPLALAVAAAVTFTAGCASLGLLWVPGLVPVGVAAVAGCLAATVALLVLEWRIHGQ